jgi:galactose-1-phosphate uridylyltransferase
MTLPYWREPEYLTVMDDGTVKQLNPFTGTEVWTVAGRGKRPIASQAVDPVPLKAEERDDYCVFCSARYAQTPPEKSRVIRDTDGSWLTQYRVLPDAWYSPVAEFRRIPNLFEILSYDYWHANYTYELPAELRDHESDYLALPAGREHVTAVLGNKLKAMGKTDTEIKALSDEEFFTHAAAFFGSSHDVIVARRHFTDDATDTTGLASAGTLSVEEHEEFIKYTIESAKDLYQQNRYARYVAIFQNWLRPAGASMDHLHKQLVAIDEWGVQHQQAIQLLRSNPNIFN